ncbi:MAG: hypothetical protein L3J66_12325 [Bacteroidales bacterium]|nr:hypothetical protein [Bacteroidales bacterium]
MKVERIKNRIYYNIGTIIILMGFAYVFLKPGTKGELSEYLLLIFLTGTGFCAAARAFYFDRYLRIIRKKPIVDLWLFLNNTKFEWLMFTYFYIRPVFGQKKNQNLEKTRMKINIYAICAYFLLTGLIITMITNRN